MHRYLIVSIAVASLLSSSTPAVAQFAQQSPKLVGTGVVGAARQGTSVAISARQLFNRAAPTPAEPSRSAGRAGS